MPGETLALQAGGPRTGDESTAPVEMMDPVRLPPIAVDTRGAEVEAFARETGFTKPIDFVPLTFPFRWLTLPAIRPVIKQMIGGDDFLPVHEGQSFEYQKRLRKDAHYLMGLEFTREAKPPRLIIRGAISTPDGEPCLTMETILRIVPVTQGTP
ncbi:MAG TPA: hypothetical protein VEQ35_03490 [Beijerinckia sp.]|jgi:hypothetical protein|nr:hypothetical protein [Beijerinckia sp.]